MNVSIRLFLTAVAVSIAGLVASPLVAQDKADLKAQANNPLAAFKTINLQTQYTGSLTDTTKSANTFYLRGAMPVNIGSSSWLVRATLPVNSWPVGVSGSQETGIGDFNIFAAYLFETKDPAISFGIGPQLTVPTATNDALGSEKWSLGLANVLFDARNKKFQWGYLLTWQASVAGNKDRNDVNFGAFQPFGMYQLNNGWYLRSTGVWTYNFENDDYAMPVGFGIGKVTVTSKSVINAYIEPQYSIATRGSGQSEWGVFAGINFQFK